MVYMTYVIYDISVKYQVHSMHVLLVQICTVQKYV